MSITLMDGRKGIHFLLEKKLALSGSIGSTCVSVQQTVGTLPWRVCTVFLCADLLCCWVLGTASCTLKLLAPQWLSYCPTSS